MSTNRFANLYGPKDAEMVLDDGVTVHTTVGVNLGEVSGTDKIIDLGADTYRELDIAGQGAYCRKDMVIDVSAIDDADADETYEFELQLSTSPTFASDVVRRGSIKLGDGGTFVDHNLPGRFTMPTDNEVGEKVYRYARVSINAGGTTPSITASVYFMPAPRA